MIIHELKCHSVFYHRVADGSKTFEIRKNDRDFQTGDIVILREWDDVEGVYVGEDDPIHAKITYISRFAQMDGWVVLALRKIPAESLEDQIPF